MKFNQATDYAFRMIVHMSMLPVGTKKTGVELARAECSPERFLLKIMRSLIHAKIMKSYRGVEGGFALQREPKDITLLDVVVAVEGDAYLQKCLYDVDSCSRGCQGHCALHECIGAIQTKLIEMLESENFATLAMREKKIRSELHICSDSAQCAVEQVV